MSGNAPEIDLPQLPNARVAIISSSWHLDICNDLVAGAQRALTAAAIINVEVIYVPGSFEIPLASQIAFEKGFDAVVAVGLVQEGETPHFDYVCQGVTQGVMDVSLKFSARSGRPGSSEDKGYDSAVAAIKLLELKAK
jgi:6,7-dimethyl-8-ribityllumazine synthase